MKLGLRGLPADQLPDWKPILKNGWFSFLPIILLVILLNYWSASKVGFWVIVCSVLLSFIRKETRMTPKKFFSALVDSGKGMLEVGASCAISGIVVGVFGLLPLMHCHSSAGKTAVINKSQFVLIHCVCRLESAR